MKPSNLSTLALTLTALLTLASFGISAHNDPTIAPFETGSPVWRPTASGPLVTFAAPLVDPGRFVLQPLLFHNRIRGTFDSSGRRHALPAGDRRSNTVVQLFAQHGLDRRTELDAQFNVLSSRIREDGRAASDTRLGDTQLILRRLLGAESDDTLHPELTLFTQVKLPTGKSDGGAPGKLGTDLSGTGSVDLTAGLDLTKAYRPAILHANLWFTRPLEATVDGERVRNGNMVNLNVAAEVPFGDERYGLLLETSALIQDDRRVEGMTLIDSGIRSIAVGGGLEFNVRKDMQALVAAQRTIDGRNTDVVETYAATVVWTFQVLGSGRRERPWTRSSSSTVPG